MANDPATKRIAEGDRDADLGFDADKGAIGAPVQIGEEDWRDGGTDDGEQDSDDALSDT